MEVSQMNKTAILSFVIDEIALKCRKVSKNMKKRIHWMLKYREITVKKYDERALILNGWIRVGEEQMWVKKAKDMHKGVSNYIFKDQPQIDRALSLNNEIRCEGIKFQLTRPIQVKSIQYLIVDHDNYEVFLKSTFNKVEGLFLRNLWTDQVESILKRFNRIDKLTIRLSSLKRIDFRKSQIKEFFFKSVSFKEQVYLTRELDQLDLDCCESPCLAKAQRVKEIYFNGTDNSSKDFEILARSLKGVKGASIDNLPKSILFSLPSTIRRLYARGLEFEVDDSRQLFRKFHRLIHIDGPFPINLAQTTNLKAINPKMTETEEKFDFKPKEITVNSKNVHQLNKHPELFEKVDCVVIYTDEFNFELLPREIKRIFIFDGVNEESMTLNRLKKECE